MDEAASVNVGTGETEAVGEGLGVVIGDGVGKGDTPMSITHIFPSTEFVKYSLEV